MIPKAFIILFITLAPAVLLAQPNREVPPPPRSFAAEELERVINDASTLENKNALVTIKARAAMLVSFSDPARAEKMFLELWKYTDEQIAKDFDKEQAKLQILKSLSVRDPKLARSLLAQSRNTNNSSLPTADVAHADDDSRLTAKLAFELVDSDPASAAALVENALATSASPAAMGALLRLRQKDSLLSDYVATRMVDGLGSQPTFLSLRGLQLLAAYVFPGPDAPISSVEAETSLQSVQFKYFLAGVDVLRASLKETNDSLRDQHYTAADVQFRAANQGQIAAILAALAPRLQPSFAVELSEIANRLGAQLPPNVSQMMRLPLARLSGNDLDSNDPEQKFFFALTKGDFAEARQQLDRLPDEKRSVYTQLLVKKEAQALLAKSDVMGAVAAIRKLEDHTARLVMYLDAIKAAKRKRDPELTTIIINEARLLIPQTDRNGLHLRALLSFVAQLAKPNTNDDAMDFLANAVVTINRLSNAVRETGKSRSLAEEAMAELNDPLSLLDAPEMEQAFSSAGLMDFERTLAQASKIEPRPVQLAARLETLQGFLKNIGKRPK